MANCGAKTRNGQPCKSKAMANGRCRMHGGSTKGGGAPKDNKSAVKAGSIYSKYLTDDENSFVEVVEVGDLTHEIKLAKLQVLRIQKEMQANKDGADLELSSAQVVERDGTKTTTMQKQRRDYHGLLDRALGRVASLELAQKARLDGVVVDDEIEPKTIVFEVAPPNADVRVTIGKKRETE